MEDIKIKKCSRSDLNAISDICYKTGFMGEDLTGSGRFSDKILFCRLFCTYYLLYEAGNCFVAWDNAAGTAVGYIIGSENSINQEKNFIRKMIPGIIFRMCTYTIFFHPESFNAVLLFIKSLKLENVRKAVYLEYPAHLHMNILYKYQRKGIRGMLLNTFENHMKNKNISGIHIWTSNKNVKAIPFYKKHGYEILYEKENKIWAGVEGYKDVICGKKI